MGVNETTAACALGLNTRADLNAYKSASPR